MPTRALPIEVAALRAAGAHDLAAQTAHHIQTNELLSLQATSAGRGL